MWYIIPLIICLLGGMFIPNIVDKNDCEENGCVLFELKYKYSEQDYINLKNNILCILIP